MSASLRHLAEVEPFRLPNRWVREVFSGRNGLASGCSFRVVEVDPEDEEVPRVPHLHRQMEEIIVVARGQGALWVEGQWTRVGAGDAWIVARDTRHATVNPGPDVLQLYCFFSSARPEADILELREQPLTGWRALWADRP